MSHTKLPLFPEPEPPPAIANARALPAAELRRFLRGATPPAPKPAPTAKTLPFLPSPAALEHVARALGQHVSERERAALARVVQLHPELGQRVLDGRLRSLSSTFADELTSAAENRAGNTHHTPEPTSLTEAAEHRARTNHGGNDAA